MVGRGWGAVVFYFAAQILGGCDDDAEVVRPGPPPDARMDVAPSGSDGSVMDDSGGADVDGPSVSDAGGGADADGPADDAGPAPDTAGGGDGGIACGTTTCGPSQLCLIECSPCGAAPVCEPAGSADAGACPAGFVACTTAQNQPGCERDCRPPPPRCIDIPAGCGPTPTCACFGGPGGCVAVQEGRVYTACPP